MKRRMPSVFGKSAKRICMCETPSAAHRLICSATCWGVPISALSGAVQKGLASGHYAPGRLNPKRESGVWHFQNLLRAAYAGPAGESA